MGTGGEGQGLGAKVEMGTWTGLGMEVQPLPLTRTHENFNHVARPCPLAWCSRMSGCHPERLDQGLLMEVTRAEPA